MEEEGLPKNPDLELAQLQFLLTTGGFESRYGDREQILTRVLEKIKEDKMAPFYEQLYASLGLETNAVLLKELKQANTVAIEEFDKQHEEAVKSLGETEVRESLLKKAEYLCKIGDKEAAVPAFEKAYEKTVSFGQRLDIQFNLIRLGLFYMDHSLISKSLDKAKKLIDEGGDWDRRNRLKVYEGLYSMAIRDFKKASNLFLEALATFTSTELFPYKQFVAYCVIVSSLTLSRVDLHKKVVSSSEIKEVLFEYPLIRDYLSNLYECQYSKFFQSLAEIETELKFDRYLAPHYRFYVREMRILAYSQFLEAYRSVTLSSIAATFGVSVEFMDRELARFIAAGRLHCKIDKVTGIIETTRPDTKNAQYQSLIKQGDNLLNRLQKLSRVINI